MKLDRKAVRSVLWSVVAAFVVSAAIAAANFDPLDGRAWLVAVGVGLGCALVAATIGLTLGAQGSRRRARSR